MSVAYLETPDAEPLGVRRQFGKSLLGRLLDERFGTRTAAVETLESGQPIVVGASEPAFVSLTHTDRLVAAVLAPTRVGIDAEPLDNTHSHPSLHSRVCSTAELSWLEQLPEFQRNQGFLRLWTRKESYGKAIGVGLGFEWRSTRFNPDDAALAGVAGEWHARELDLGPDVVAAVVVEGAQAAVAVTKVDWRDVAHLG